MNWNLFIRIRTQSWRVYARDMDTLGCPASLYLACAFTSQRPELSRLFFSSLSFLRPSGHHPTACLNLGATSKIGQQA